MINPSILRRQKLSTGEWIEHDVYEATRIPLFATEQSDWPVASLGGTILVLRYCEKIFAISARHILGVPPFEPASLIIHERNRTPSGHKLRFLQATTLEVPQSERDGGTDDAFDLVVWEFDPSETPSVQAFYWDSATISEAQPGAALLVVGYLFDKTTLSVLDANTGAVAAQVAKFGFYHVRQSGDDQSSMRGVAIYPIVEARTFGNFKGLSGAPVYDATSNRICGMVLRAGLDLETGTARIYFLSALYIDRCLASLYRADPTIDLAVQIF